MKLVFDRLSNLCDIQIGKTPSRSISKYWGEGYPWVAISDLKNRYICNTKETITQIAVNETKCKLIPKNTLLMSFKLSIGKLAFTACDLYTNEAIAALLIKDKKQLHNDFLYYALKNIPLLKGAKVAVKGNTLNKKSLGKLKIPLPETLDDQIKIANLLTYIEELISKREKSIKLLDELLKSTFLDMFGDPINNPFQYKKVTLKDVCLYKGEYGSGASAIEYDLGLPRYLRITDINEDGSLSNDKKAPDKIEERYFLEFGDILFTRTGATVGKTYLHKTDEWLQYAGYLIRFKPNFEIINPDYLLYYTKSGYYSYWVSKKQRAVGQPNINAKEYGDLPLLLPPKTLQDKFSTIVQQVEATKIHYLRSLDELNNLFGSLSQRAFRGELDLSKMEIPDSWTKKTLAKQEAYEKTWEKNVYESGLERTETVSFEKKSLDKLETFIMDLMKSDTFDMKGMRQYFDTDFDYNEFKEKFYKLLKKGGIRQVFDTEHKKMRFEIVS